MRITPAVDDGRLLAALRHLSPRQLECLRSVWLGEHRRRTEPLTGLDAQTFLSVVRRGLVRDGALTAAGLHAIDRRSDDPRPDCLGCAGLGGLPLTLPAGGWAPCAWCGGLGFCSSETGRESARAAGKEREACRR